MSFQTAKTVSPIVNGLSKKIPSGIFAMYSVPELSSTDTVTLSPKYSIEFTSTFKLPLDRSRLNKSTLQIQVCLST